MIRVKLKTAIDTTVTEYGPSIVDQNMVYLFGRNTIIRKPRQAVDILTLKPRSGDLESCSRAEV